MSKQPLPLLNVLQRLRLAFWQRRVIQGLVRSFWLTLLVPTMVMLGYLWFEVQLSWLLWLPLTLLVFALSLLWAFRPLTLRAMVERLEQQLSLQNRLITAYEATRDAPVVTQNPILQRLFQDTVYLAAQIRQRVRLLNIGLWLEIEALIAVTALFSALMIFDAIVPRVPDITAAELPSAWEEPRAEEILDPDVMLMPPPFQQPFPELSAQQIQQMLETIADSLRDQAATRSIAEALDQGDLAAAAEGLRQLADQLEQLSPGAQSELSEALQGAAQEIGQGAPGVTEPLQTGGAALGGGNTRQASQALAALAQALESIAQAQEAQALAEGAESSGENQPGGEQQQPGQGGSGEQQPAAEEPQAGQQPDESGTEEGAAAEEGSGEEEAEAMAEAPPPPGNGDGGAGDSEPGEQPEGGEAESGQPSEPERLGIEGQPLELENFDDPDVDDGLDEQVLQPAELDAEVGDRTTQDSPFGRPRGTNEELGPDTLSYPWQKREVIRRYFTGTE